MYMQLVERPMPGVGKGTCLGDDEEAGDQAHHPGQHLRAESHKRTPMSSCAAAANPALHPEGRQFPAVSPPLHRLARCNTLARQAHMLTHALAAVLLFAAIWMHKVAMQDLGGAGICRRCLVALFIADT